MKTGAMVKVVNPYGDGYAWLHESELGGTDSKGRPWRRWAEADPPESPPLEVVCAVVPDIPENQAAPVTPLEGGLAPLAEAIIDISDITRPDHGADHRVSPSTPPKKRLRKPRPSRAKPKPKPEVLL